MSDETVKCKHPIVAASITLAVAALMAISFFLVAVDRLDARLEYQQRLTQEARR